MRIQALIFALTITAAFVLLGAYSDYEKQPICGVIGKASCQKQEEIKLPCEASSFTETHFFMFDTNLIQKLLINTLDILEDSKGQLWFATYDKGLVGYDGENFNFYELKINGKTPVVRQIYEHSNGHLLLATDMGLMEVSLRQGTLVSNVLLEGYDVLEMAFNSDNEILMRTSEGLSLYRESKAIPFEVPKLCKTEKRDSIHSIFTNMEGMTLIVCDSGLSRIVDEKHEYYAFDGSYSNLVVTDILHSSKYGILLATESKGILKLEDKGLVPFGESQNLSGFKTWQIYEDANGLLWVAASTIGVHVYDGDAWRKLFTAKHCLSHTITDISQDSKGNYWFAGWTGLYRSEQ